MADDRMKNDDLNRNVGGRGTEDEATREQRSPGRNIDDEQSTSRRQGNDEPNGDEEIRSGNKGNKGDQDRTGRQ